MLLVSLVEAVAGWVILRAERAEPVTLGDVPWGMISRETLARALFRVTGPLGWGRDALPPIARSSIPVVLVPDPRRGRQTVAPLAWFLRERGFDVIHRASLRSSEGKGLAELAAELGAQIDAVLRATGAPRVEIVAHDGGGLVAAWWLVHLGGAQRANRLVTLGTPWRGTKNAVFSGGRFAREVAWASPRLDGLSPTGVPTACVWSQDDPSIVPSESALAHGAESVRTDGAGHMEMLLSARCFRAVHVALGVRTPAGVT